jgi:hypothetical protein
MAMQNKWERIAIFFPKKSKIYIRKKATLNSVTRLEMFFLKAPGTDVMIN